MSVNRRKIYIGAIALQGVLLAYFIVAYLNPSVKIPLSNQIQIKSVSEKSDEQIGRVGELGIGEVETAKFVDFNKDKTVSREFGFEKMLHRSGEQWQVEKPFMNIYQDQLQCRITADKAIILAGQTGSTPSFKEATLTGNVVVKILPAEKSNTGPIMIYLDDIVFISERSLFLTAGPVKIINKDAQLIGRGLELVYNYELDRIELFRIIHLETLCLNNIAQYQIAPKEQKGTSYSTETAVSLSEDSSTVKYQAVFSGNVLIRTEQQLVFADDRLNILNILRKKNQRGKKEADNLIAAGTGQKTTTKEQPGFMDVILTCENGLVFKPMDSTSEKIGFLPIARRQSILGRKKVEQLRDSWERDSILTSIITYDSVKQTAVASGNSELTFKLNQANDSQNQQAPVTINTDENITFDSKSNRIIFTGSSNTVFCRTEQQGLRRYTLTAQKLIVDLVNSQNSKDSTNLNTQLSQSLPATITAHKATIFNLSADTLNPNSQTQQGGSSNMDYALSADVITAQLDKSNDPNISSTSGDIQTINADGNAIVSISDPILKAKTAEFSVGQISYNSATQNIIAKGPSLLDIYNNEKNNKPSLTDHVQITAQEQTTFSLLSNQVVFLGDCECSLVLADSKMPRKLTLKAPRIVADLAADATDSTISNAPSSIKQITAADNAAIIVTPVDSIAELAKFNAPQISYFAAGQNVIAKGPCDFSFYANDFMPAESLGAAIPVSITAQELTFFSPVENKVVFKGDCICTMVRTRGDSQNKYTLSAPRLSINLSKNKYAGPSSSAMEIDYVIADSGTVQLSSVKTFEGKLKEFSKIKCSALEFDTKTRIVSATGPGVITVDNSKIDEPEISSDVLSLNKKCYAFVRDFENLKFLLKTNQIIAHNNNSKMLLDYFPVENNENKTQIKASAGSIEINMRSFGDKATELSSLKAGGGITYEDQKNEFSAGQITYDASTAVIRAQSDEFHRCYLNGAIVDNILYNIEQSAVTSIEMKDPAIVQTNQ